MLVRKRNGTKEPVSKAKIHKFLRHAGQKSPQKLTDTIVMGMPRQIDAERLNEYFANTAQAAGLTLTAGRIEMLNIHKITPSSFTEAMMSLPLDRSFQQKVAQLDLDKACPPRKRLYVRSLRTSNTGEILPYARRI